MIELLMGLLLLGTMACFVAIVVLALWFWEWRHEK